MQRWKKSRFVGNHEFVLDVWSWLQMPELKGNIAAFSKGRRQLGQLVNRLLYGFGSAIFLLTFVALLSVVVTTPPVSHSHCRPGNRKKRVRLWGGGGRLLGKNKFFPESASVHYRQKQGPVGKA